MTDDVAATTYEISSPSAAPVAVGEAPSGAPSSLESSLPTTSDEGRPGDPLGAPEGMAGALPSRLAARMGGEHSAWSFADPSDAEAWATAAREFCRDYCPIDHRCAGERCRVFRFEHAAMTAGEGAIS